ncbi:carbohydrate ABC transporter substrate-binding protein, CUT1 family [Paenibacillus sp. UNCCL117]|uniref:extracellular solute-binding protein n=1 Tax=unclassified Paenibacillus TaxID=185978 RepID=UPI000884B5C2|nr:MULTISPECIES: extracellular solute-binding protein [unclassified Paenibacillus]SDE20545.1 putative aldouronate transport system substrate-binding protein [Paenibacillus sp. cl123]SFW61693.1 carbohydrate ABC transporter substrate-binding protein, CUT1 family [Paenibacillus sp. UNCCL117]
MNKKLSVLCALLLSVGGIMGCSKQPDAGGPGKSAEPAAAAELDEKLTINWMARAYQGGGWPDDHPMIQELNRKFNVDLKIQWVPAANYKEKLNVLAASNDFPDVFLVLSSEFNKWKKQGLFLDTQPVLSQYPNLAAIPPEAARILNPKGKMLGFPYYITQTRDSLSVREDWLKALNLQPPKTMDEFYEVAKAFATRDPDGNGKQDTSGFSFYIDTDSVFRDLEFAMAAFGLGNQWSEVNGQLVPYQTQVEEWKKLLTFLSKAYSEGVLDKDFAVNKVRGPLDKFEASKIGFANINPNQYKSTTDNLTKLVPTAVHAPIDPPKGPTGLTGTQSLDMLDKNVINAKIDPKKQRRILMMLDYFLSPEGSDFIKHGIEGTHYKKVSADKYEKLPAADKDRQNLINNWIFRPFDPGIQMYKWEDPAQHQFIREMFARNEKHRWANAAAGLESETMNRSGANLNAKFVEAVTKIIMGRDPVSAIEKASADWLAGGGSKIIDEINKAYKE